MSLSKTQLISPANTTVVAVLSIIDVITRCADVTRMSQSHVAIVDDLRLWWRHSMFFSATHSTVPSSCYNRRTLSPAGQFSCCQRVNDRIIRLNQRRQWLWYAEQSNRTLMCAAPLLYTPCSWSNTAIVTGTKQWQQCAAKRTHFLTIKPQYSYAPQYTVVKLFDFDWIGCFVPLWTNSQTLVFNISSNLISFSLEEEI